MHFMLLLIVSDIWIPTHWLNLWLVPECILASGKLSRHSTCLFRLPFRKTVVKKCSVKHMLLLFQKKSYYWILTKGPFIEFFISYIIHNIPFYLSTLNSIHLHIYPAKWAFWVENTYRFVYWPSLNRKYQGTGWQKQMWSCKSSECRPWQWMANECALPLGLSRSDFGEIGIDRFL